MAAPIRLSGADQMIPAVPGPALPATARAPTRPAAVTQATALQALNLNWRECDLPERERTRHVHRLHPYLGKFIPQLAEVFLRKYFQPGQVVLDPFMGSGTTLVQANELGIHSVGCDISAFNALLCRAKTAVYDLAALRAEVSEILEEAWIGIQQKTAGGQGEATAMVAADAYLQAWFAPQALLELLAFRDCIPHYQSQDLLQVILSRAARSARLTTHFDLDFPKTPQATPYYCYKHRRECTPVTTAYPFLQRYALDALARIEAFAQVRSAARVEILHADSRTAAFPAIDGILTSPPYVGLIDYHAQHAYAYHLLGLADRRVDEIGAATEGASKKARLAYQQAIAAVLRNAGHRLAPGGRVAIVVADRHGLYPEIARLAGFVEEDRVLRQVDRRTGRRAAPFHESILVWRKP